MWCRLLTSLFVFCILALWSKPLEAQDRREKSKAWQKFSGPYSENALPNRVWDSGNTVYIGDARNRDFARARMQELMKTTKLSPLQAARKIEQEIIKAYTQGLIAGRDPRSRHNARKSVIAVLNEMRGAQLLGLRLDNGAMAIVGRRKQWMQFLRDDPSFRLCQEQKYLSPKWGFTRAIGELGKIDRRNNPAGFQFVTGRNAVRSLQAPIRRLRAALQSLPKNRWLAYSSEIQALYQRIGGIHRKTVAFASKAPKLGGAGAIVGAFLSLSPILQAN